MAMIDIFKKVVAKKEKTNQPPESRSAKEARIKDKAGFVIVLLAALLAINTMIGGSNSSKIQSHTILISSNWAWYQAKNTRGVLYEISAENATNPDTVAKFKAESARMDSDKKEIAATAKKLEAERDDAKKRSPWFTWAGSTLQIAIVLLTASILAVSWPLFYLSLGFGISGAIFVSQAVWLWLPI
jgi:uncharacterized protein HemX